MLLEKGTPKCGEEEEIEKENQIIVDSENSF